MLVVDKAAAQHGLGRHGLAHGRPPQLRHPRGRPRGLHQVLPRRDRLLPQRPGPAARVRLRLAHGARAPEPVGRRTSRATTTAGSPTPSGRSPSAPRASTPTCATPSRRRAKRLGVRFVDGVALVEVLTADGRVTGAAGFALRRRRLRRRRGRRRRPRHGLAELRPHRDVVRHRQRHPRRLARRRRDAQRRVRQHVRLRPRRRRRCSCSTASTAAPTRLTTTCTTPGARTSARSTARACTRPWTRSRPSPGTRRRWPATAPSPPTSATGRARTSSASTPRRSAQPPRRAGEGRTTPSRRSSRSSPGFIGELSCVKVDLQMETDGARACSPWATRPAAAARAAAPCPRRRPRCTAWASPTPCSWACAAARRRRCTRGRRGGPAPAPHGRGAGCASIEERAVRAAGRREGVSPREVIPLVQEAVGAGRLQRHQDGGAHARGPGHGPRRPQAPAGASRPPTCTSSRAAWTCRAWRSRRRCSTAPPSSAPSRAASTCARTSPRRTMRSGSSGSIVSRTATGWRLRTDDVPLERYPYRPAPKDA